MNYEELQKRVSEQLKKMTQPELKQLMALVNAAASEVKSKIAPEERSKKDKWQQFGDEEIRTVFKRITGIPVDYHTGRKEMIMLLNAWESNANSISNLGANESK